MVKKGSSLANATNQAASCAIDRHASPALNILEHPASKMESVARTTKRPIHPVNVLLSLPLCGVGGAVADEMCVGKLAGHGLQIVKRHALSEENAVHPTISQDLMNEQQGNVVDFTLWQVQHIHLVLRP